MPGISALFGCDGKATRPTFTEIENGIVYKYWNCIMKFIPKNIAEFARQYSFHKNFPSSPMPDYKKLSYKWLMAYQYLENKKNEYMAETAKGK